MRDSTAILVDSLSKLSAAPASSAATDAMMNDGRSGIALWLEKLLATDALYLFILSLILALGGATFSYLFYHRSKRTRSNDRMQSQALVLASIAMGVLATKGVFFILATASFAGVIPDAYADLFLRLGWQFSMLWFLYFGFIFSLSFVRSRKSYDAYYLVALTLLFILLTIVYTQGTLHVSLWSPAFSVEMSGFPAYTLAAHLGLWVYLFLYVAYRVYRRSRSYRDLSARRALLLLSGAMLVVAGFGVLNLLLMRNNLPALQGLSYAVALSTMFLFYFSVRNAYKHGRYKRV